MNDRNTEKRKRASMTTFDPSNVALDTGEEPRATTLCAFCVEHPSGSSGHAGFAQQAHKIPVTDRSYVRLACVFCGTTWVRRRLNARTYEWLRLAD
jgi:hypothetical protein